MLLNMKSLLCECRPKFTMQYVLASKSCELLTSKRYVYMCVICRDSRGMLAEQHVFVSDSCELLLKQL